MTLTINKKLVPDGLKTNPNKNMAKVKYITAHTTGNRNAGATAKMHADYQFNGAGGTQTSWHYTVDDKEIWQSFDDNRACWHAGDGNGDGNTASIGVEICVNAGKDGFLKACENAARLTAELLTRHGLDVSAVKQHFDWSKKDCPKELRSGEWGINWGGFLEMVKSNLNTAAANAPNVPKTPILGKNQYSADVLSAFLLKNNPQPQITCAAVDLARFFVDEGARVGVRGDLAFIQACHETGYFKFGGDVKPEQNNFAGLGATGGGNPGCSFKTAQDGAAAVVQHLFAYASTSSLPVGVVCVDTRFGLVNRGCAPYLEDLTGKWAADKGYHVKILAKWAELEKFAAAFTPPIEPTDKEKLLALIAGSKINSPEYWVNALTGFNYFSGFVGALWEKYEGKK